MSTKPKAKPPFKNRFVEVRWHDTLSDSKWRDINEHLDVAVVRSRGWVIADNKRSITLAASVIEHGDAEGFTVGDVTTIPKGCIEEIKDIR